MIGQSSSKVTVMSLGFLGPQVPPGTVQWGGVGLWRVRVRVHDNQDALFFFFGLQVVLPKQKWCCICIKCKRNILASGLRLTQSFLMFLHDEPLLQGI